MASTVAVVAAMVLTLLGWGRSALAGPEINIPRAEDGPGLKAGQRSTFHPGFALVSGFDSNVFVNAKGEPRTSGVGPAPAAFLMPTGWLGVGNRKFRDGLLMTPPERSGRNLDYYIGAIAGFRQYLARNRNILGQSRLSGGVQMRLAFLPGRKFSVNFDEDAFRYAQPSTYEAAPQYNFNRIDHKGQLTFIGRPGGGRFEMSLGLRNQVLFFENRARSFDLPKGNRTVNGFLTELKWRFLPKSALVLDYGMDWTYYLSCCTDVGSGRNEDNFAHRITGGFRGQILKKVVLDALAGYGLGYYRQDPNGPNFSSFIGELAVSYYPTQRSLLHVSLYRSFQDSLLGNYYVDLGARIQGRYEFKWNMIATVGAWVAGRRYAGLPVEGFEDTSIIRYEGPHAAIYQRRDTLFNLLAKIEQPIGRLWVVGFSYDLAVDSTDHITVFEVEDPTNPGGTREAFDIAGFNRHVVLLLGAIRI